ncbi:hypothetical protein BS47DRAFT_1369649 [Hydnum rufescens UP504]|uniref:Uncharacterized protein n=1 Tax=Hydnum rufescens UP504 TaxID=1448309 RepID=A0A9P6ADC8_9AGAM|nr:hypothetical protein BS47DRAFT_1369649 [Hydnum rufescens UP504]
MTSKPADCFQVSFNIVAETPVVFLKPVVQPHRKGHDCVATGVGWYSWTTAWVPFQESSEKITLLCNAIAELRTTVTTMNMTLVKLVLAPVASGADSLEVPSLEALNITASPVDISPVQLNFIPISTIPIVSPIIAPAAFPAMMSITVGLTVSPSTLPSPAPIATPNPPTKALSGVQFGEAMRDVFFSQHWYLITKGLQTGVSHTVYYCIPNAGAGWIHYGHALQAGNVKTITP